MATHGDIGISQPIASTITMKVATVTQTWNSTVAHQELLIISGAESTLEIGRVMATAPGSTDYGLVVRIAGGPSSAADATFRVNQGIGNSSAADRWRVETANSSAADYRAARIVDSSGTGFHGPTNPFPVAFTDSSNAVVKAADSVNNAVRVNVVAGTAASTIVTIARQVGNSSAADYMPARLVDSSGTGFHGPANPVPFALTDSSNAVVKVADSVNNAVRVNVIAGSAASTIVTIARQVGNSSAADYMPARMVDSSGTGFHGPANPFPIAITDSSNAVVKSGDSANNAIRVNVVAGAAAGSTNVTLSVPLTWATVAQSTVGQTTATVIISSAATVPYIAAFTATSTEAGPIVCAFMEGSTMLWPFTLWAEGGVPNVSQAVGPTSFIFKGSANRPVSLNILSGSTGTIYLGVTYKQE